MNVSNVYIKFLIKVHTLIGIFAIFFFFLATYFGSITLFKPYFNSWQNPSRHFEIVENKELNLDFALHKALKELKYPNDNIDIVLPSFKDKALAVSTGFSRKVYINPYTNKVLDTKNENNLITTFLNDIHVGRNIPIIGQTLMGMSCLAIIFLSISGVFLWLVNRNKKRKIAKKAWFKWHKDLSLVLIPYIIIFALTGSFLGFMLNNSKPFSLSATDYKTNSLRKLVGPIIFAKTPKVEKTKQNVDMLEYSKLYEKAQKIYPNLQIKNIKINAWYESNAQIEFLGYLKDNKILTGSINRVKLILKGSDGSIVTKKTFEDTHTMNKFMSAFYVFHFFPDQEFTTRLIFFALGVLCAVSLAFGLLIWLDKKESENKNNPLYFNFTSKLALCVIVGVIPASSLLFLLHWLVPFDLGNRNTILTGSFYAFWSMTLFYSVYKTKAKEVIKHFLYTSSVFIFLAVLFHGIKTNIYIWDSFKMNLPVIFWVDFSFLVFAFICIYIAFKIKVQKVTK